MSTPRRSNGEQGFTLIEALIAIVILAFGLIAVANLFIVATSSNQIANSATVAATQSSFVLERLKAIPFTTLVPGGSIIADVGATGACSVLTQATFNCIEDIPGVGRVRSRWIIVNPDPGGSDTYMITVSSQALLTFGQSASRSEFTTYRTCVTQGCPYPGAS